MAGPGWFRYCAVPQLTNAAAAGTVRRAYAALGESSRMSEMDGWYDVLGLEPGASPEDVKQAYRDMVRVWHPDRFGSDERLREKAQEKQKEINLAYDKLKDYEPPPEGEEPAEAADAPEPPKGRAKAQGKKARPSKRKRRKGRRRSSVPRVAREGPSPFDNPEPPVARKKQPLLDTWDLRKPLGMRTVDGVPLGQSDEGDVGRGGKGGLFVVVLTVLVLVVVVVVVLL